MTSLFRHRDTPKGGVVLFGFHTSCCSRVIMPSRRCYFHPSVTSPLFGLPRDAALREQWLTFIFKSVPTQYNPHIALCAAHMAEDRFLNLPQFNAGYAQRLFLKDGAVPTLSGEGVVYGPQRSSSRQQASSQEFPVTSLLHEAPCQTETVHIQTSPMRRSVGTQLSASTLSKLRVRSKGIQATVSSRDVGTETMIMLPDMGLSSTAVRGSIFRPRKRPRLEMEEEEHRESELHVEPHDFTCNPKSPTQESELSIDPESNYGDNKYIVFESCLRQLFESCPVCKANCEVRKRQMGTFVAFTQLCQKCQYHRRWQSQPVIGRTPVGNLQLCAATYFLGGSYAKLQKIFKAMQLQTVQYDTYQRHARNFIEPTIIHKWNRDQQHLMRQLREREKVAIAGDMHADSPGHSAKFGCYTVMDMETNSIMDLQLIQSNEAGGSYHMEKEGLKRCLDKMESCGLVFDYIVTDRHPQIQKYLRERNVTQYYDVWHFEKALSKNLHKLSQSKDCEVLKKWSKSIKNHLYWSATSSVSGPEKVAKWTSLLNHIQNIHVHDNPLFPKCEHPDRVLRDPIKWFQAGSVALHKVEKLTSNKSVLKDFEKLSHHVQTSSLEAFHSLILRFAPKNVVFHFIGMLCRFYLAAMHYNENAKHPHSTSTQRQAVYNIGFPKSKQGECTAKPVKTDPTYNCVDDLMSLLLSEVIMDSTPYAEELHQITVPPPLSSQFEKPFKEDVIARQLHQFSREGAGIQHTAQLDPEIARGYSRKLVM